MTYAHVDLHDDFETLPQMPSWITQARPESFEDVAFMSGAALSHLHHIIHCSDVPLALLRNRLALRAAEACVALSGRSERAGALRDEVHLLRPGDRPGPAGRTLLQWQKAVARPVSVGALAKALPSMTGEEIAEWLDQCDQCNPSCGGPIARAAAVLGAVLTDRPREEAMAAILADAALAQALGWDHIVPLLAAGLKSGDWRKTGGDLQLACHRAVRSSALEAYRLSVDLTRRAARLRNITPKLRAKGAGAAVEMFLSRDAVLPAALPLPDRAARRLCDRLVELGGVRELTGRDTFRLYGV